MTSSSAALTIVNPPALPDPSANGYSTATVVPAGGRLAFVSGQGGFDAKGELPADFAAQVARTYDNLLAAVAGLGAGPEQVAKLTVFVVDHDMSKLAVLTEAVTHAFGDRLPAQTLVGVDRLAIDAMLFEVEAIVALG